MLFAQPASWILHSVVDLVCHCHGVVIVVIVAVVAIVLVSVVEAEEAEKVLLQITF